MRQRRRWIRRLLRRHSHHPFNLEAYLARQSPAKQKLATMLRHAAKRHRIDERLVLAIAIAESNLDSRAVSPRMPRG